MNEEQYYTAITQFKLSVKWQQQSFSY